MQNGFWRTLPLAGWPQSRSKLLLAESSEVFLCLQQLRRFLWYVGSLWHVLLMRLAIGAQLGVANYQ